MLETTQIYGPGLPPPAEPPLTLETIWKAAAPVGNYPAPAGSKFVGGVIAADLPLPTKRVASRPYAIAEYMLTRLRDCPVDSHLMDTPEAVVACWWKTVPSSSWFRCEQESAVVFMLNARRRCIGFSLIAVGTLDTLLMHTREAYRMAIATSAAAVILCHNHPSGDPSPSEADIKVTRDIARAGNLLKIECLDHVVIGTKTETSKGWVSLRELGYFAGC